MTTIHLERAYEEPSRSDGLRIMVERLWPRGLSKERAAVDVWLKDIAPSPGLRRWFGHDPAKWEEFQKRYGAEARSEPGCGHRPPEEDPGGARHVRLRRAGRAAQRRPRPQGVPAAPSLLNRGTSPDRIRPLGCLKGSSVPRLVGGAALAAFGARSNNRRVDRRHKQGPNYGSTRTLPRPPATAAAPDITMSPLSAGGGKYRAAVFTPDHDRPHCAIDLESPGVLERPRSRSGTRVIGPPPGTQHRSDGSLRDHHRRREGLLGRWRYQTAPWSIPTAQPQRSTRSPPTCISS